MSTDQIDKADAEGPFDTYPKWIGPVLRGALPPGPEPLAVYFSWEYDVRQIPALVVLPTALVGVEIEVLGHSRVLSVTRTALGLNEVVRVSTTMRTGLVSEVETYPMETQDVEIELGQALPPFESLIRLPLSKNDYRGDWDAWKAAARSVADALLSLGIGAGPRA